MYQPVEQYRAIMAVLFALFPFHNPSYFKKWMNIHFLAHLRIAWLRGAFRVSLCPSFVVNISLTLGHTILTFKYLKKETFFENIVGK